MSVRLVLLLLLAMAAPALAQGFAGLGGDPEGFAMPERGRELVFPRDHGAHPGYRIEWWYLTRCSAPLSNPKKSLAGRIRSCGWAMQR
jgi:predicted secreted hydrolase